MKYPIKKSNKFKNFSGIDISVNGTKRYYRNGYWNRLDGPAIEGPMGYRSFYINGKVFVTEVEYWEAVKLYGALGKELG